MALDSQVDVETQLYERPSGVQRIAKEPLVPSRIIEVKKARRVPRRLGLNVFLMPRTPADPLPPWTDSRPPPAVTRSSRAPRVIRKRSRLNWLFGLVTFALAFAVFFDPAARSTVMARSRPVVARAAHYSANLSVEAWRALHR